MFFHINGEHKLSSLQKLETGVIKIGASTTVIKYFLLPYIEKFHTLFPNIDISITNSLTSNLILDLKKGSLDLLIVNLPMKNDDDLSITPCAELHDCFALVKDFAKIGMGISYITKEFAKDELDNNLLFEIPIKEKIPSRGLGIVLPKNMITSFATQKLVEIITNG